jgi:hypothetical protein
MVVATKQSLRWGYDVNARRYRDGSNGRFLPESTITTLRDGLLDARRLSADNLAEALAEGRIDLETWQLGMRAVIRDTALTEYVFGRGGVNAMEQADYGRVGAFVKEQYTYLRDFAAERLAGTVSDAQLAARAKMYAHAGVAAHSLGREATFGGTLQLPAHPGVGTACLANCRCVWQIQEGPEAWVCTWVREAGESCEVCVGRAGQYNPFVQPKVRLSVA